MPRAGPSLLHDRAPGIRPQRRPRTRSCPASAAAEGHHGGPCVVSGAMSSMADDERRQAIGQWWWVPRRTLETADRGHGSRFAQSMGATGRLFWTAQRRYLGRADGDRTKRVYEGPEPTDGFRVLVDRLWPRGLSKDDAALDLWANDVAPSSMLRSWFSVSRAAWSVTPLRRGDSRLLVGLCKGAREARRFRLDR